MLFAMRNVRFQEESGQKICKVDICQPLLTNLDL